VYSSLSFAEPASEDTAVEDTAIEDTAIEDTAIEDTATLGDSAEDTADTADSAEDTTDTTETAESTDTADTADTGVVTPASSLANEKGGFGCSKVGIGGVMAIAIALFVLFGRTREE